MFGVALETEEKEDHTDMYRTNKKGMSREVFSFSLHFQER